MATTKRAKVDLEFLLVKAELKGISIRLCLTARLCSLSARFLDL